jgi:hypothetical protein
MSDEASSACDAKLSAETTSRSANGMKLTEMQLSRSTNANVAQQQGIAHNDTE